MLFQSRRQKTTSWYSFSNLWCLATSAPVWQSCTIQSEKEVVCVWYLWFHFIPKLQNDLLSFSSYAIQQDVLTSHFLLVNVLTAFPKQLCEIWLFQINQNTNSCKCKNGFPIYVKVFSKTMFPWCVFFLFVISICPISRLMEMHQVMKLGNNWDQAVFQICLVNCCCCCCGCAFKCSFL